MAHTQSAALVFTGDQIELAYTALANWISVDHDRKGAQLGNIAYTNGTVSFISIQAFGYNAFGNGPIRSSSS